MAAPFRPSPVTCNGVPEGDSWFTIEDGRYFAAFWNKGQPRVGDCLAALWRDKGGPWHFTFRFRRYVDDKAHGSADRRNGQDVLLDPAIDEAMALRCCRRAIEAIDYPGKVSEVLLRTDSADDILHRLARVPWMHFPSAGQG